MRDDAGPVAQRLREGLAQGQGHVFQGVVRIDLQVALRLDLQVKQAVHGHLGQHVVEERQPGADRVLARCRPDARLTATRVSPVRRLTRAVRAGVCRSLFCGSGSPRSAARTASVSSGRPTLTRI